MGSALRHRALVAPPPGAKPVDTFAAVANSNDLLAPGMQKVVDPNARCVLRSGQRSLNSAPSITQPLVGNQNSSDRGTHPTLGPNKSTPSQRWLTKTTCAPDSQPAVNPNARCVLRSDLRSVNSVTSITWKFDLNRKFFGPRHTPYNGRSTRLTKAFSGMDQVAVDLHNFCDHSLDRKAFMGSQLGAIPTLLQAGTTC